MGHRHRDSATNDDLRWITQLGEASVAEVRERWARATKDMPGWKLVALARRLRALGEPVVVPERLTQALTARMRHGERASTWAALPNLQRLAHGRG